MTKSGTEAKTGERTAGPWYRDGAVVMASPFPGREDIVAVAYGCHQDCPKEDESAEANAAFIIQACNGFPALVEHLKWALSELDSLKAYMGRPERGEYGIECAVCRNEWFDSGDLKTLKEARSALEAALKTEE